MKGGSRETKGRKRNGKRENGVQEAGGCDHPVPPPPILDDKPHIAYFNPTELCFTPFTIQSMVTFWGEVKPGLKFEMDRLQTFQVE